VLEVVGKRVAEGVFLGIQEAQQSKYLERRSKGVHKVCQGVTRDGEGFFEVVGEGVPEKHFWGKNG
jgi:hypothetical protein